MAEPLPGLVQQGEPILVCDRDRVITRIERVSSATGVPSSDAEWLDRLERHGVIRRGAGRPSRAWVARRPKVKDAPHDSPLSAEDFNALLEQAKRNFPDIVGVQNVTSFDAGMNVAQLRFKLSLLNGPIKEYLRLQAACAAAEVAARPCRVWRSPYLESRDRF